MMLACRPDRFGNVLGPVAIWMICEGIVLIITGLKNHLPPVPFYPGAALCLFFGMGVWVLRHEGEAQKEGPQQSTHAGDRA